MLDDDEPRNRFRDYSEPPVRPSLLNEVPVYRDRGDARVLHRWPREMPLRAVLLDALAQTQVLLGRLEGGVYLAKDVCERDFLD